VRPLSHYSSERKISQTNKSVSFAIGYDAPTGRRRRHHEVIGILKVPQPLLNRLNAFAADDVVVAVVKRITAQDVERYQDLGISIESDELALPSSFVPPVEAGKYSRANVEGKDVVRKDLPMVTKTFSWESPNWGDWSNGSHTHYMTREVYQRDFIPPKDVQLSITLLEVRDGLEFIVKFASASKLPTSRRTCCTIDILQENLGAADVFPSAASLAQYLETVRVDWEILPVGSIDAVSPANASGEAICHRRNPTHAGAAPERHGSLSANRLHRWDKRVPEILRGAIRGQLGGV
jgi:hypothetical protein